MRMYGIHSSAGLMDLFLPNILHIIAIVMKMMIGQMIALGIADHWVTPNFHASRSVTPAFVSSPLTMLNAVEAGVPTAP